MKRILTIENVLRAEIADSFLYFLTRNELSKVSLLDLKVVWSKDLDFYDFKIINSKLYCTKGSLPQYTSILDMESGTVEVEQSQITFHFPLQKNYQNLNYCLVDDKGSRKFIDLDIENGSFTEAFQITDKKVSLPMPNSIGILCDRKTISLKDYKNDNIKWTIDPQNELGFGGKFRITNKYISEDKLVCQVSEQKSLKVELLGIQLENGEICWHKEGVFPINNYNNVISTISREGIFEIINLVTGEALESYDLSDQVNKTIKFCEHSFERDETHLVLKNSNSGNFLYINYRTKEYLFESEMDKFRFSTNEPPTIHKSYLIVNYRLSNRLNIYKLKMKDDA